MSPWTFGWSAIESLATAAALAYTARAFNAQTNERRRRQASCVSASKTNSTPDDPLDDNSLQIVEVKITNNGGQPIYDVFPLVDGHRRQAAFDVDSEEVIEGHDTKTLKIRGCRPDVRRVGAQFTDSAGRHWTRRSDGVLQDRTTSIRFLRRLRLPHDLPSGARGWPIRVWNRVGWSLYFFFGPPLYSREERRQPLNGPHILAWRRRLPFYFAPAVAFLLLALGSRRRAPLAIASLLAACAATAIAMRMTRVRNEAARHSDESLTEFVDMFNPMILGLQRSFFTEPQNDEGGHSPPQPAITPAVETPSPVAGLPVTPLLAHRRWRRRYYVVVLLALVATVLAALLVLRWATERPPRFGSQPAGAGAIIAVSDAGAPLRVDAYYDMSRSQPKQALTATVQVHTRPARPGGTVTWGMKIFNVSPNHVRCTSPVQVTRNPDNPSTDTTALLIGTATKDTRFTCTVVLPSGSQVVTRRDTRLVLLGLAQAPLRDPVPLGPSTQSREPFLFAGSKWYAPSWFAAHAAIQFDWTSYDLRRATPSGYAEDSSALQWTSSSLLPNQIVVLRSHRGEALATFEIVLAGVLLGVTGSICLTLLERLR